MTVVDTDGHVIESEAIFSDLPDRVKEKVLGGNAARWDMPTTWFNGDERRLGYDF